MMLGAGQARRQAAHLPLPLTLPTQQQPLESLPPHPLGVEPLLLPPSLPPSPVPALGLSELESSAQAGATLSRRMPFSEGDFDKEIGSDSGSEVDAAGATGDDATGPSATAPHAKSSFNRKRQAQRSAATSSLQPVSWQRNFKRWQATIRIDGKEKFLGCFLDEESAVNACQEATANEAVFKTDETVTEEMVMSAEARLSASAAESTIASTAANATVSLDVSAAASLPADPPAAPAAEGMCISERHTGKLCTILLRLPVVEGIDRNGQPFKYCAEHKCSSVGCCRAKFASGRLCRVCKTAQPGGELRKKVASLFVPGAAPALLVQPYVAMPPPQTPTLAQLAASVPPPPPPPPPPHLSPLQQLSAVPVPVPAPLPPSFSVLTPLPPSADAPRRDPTSKFPGVCWNKDKKKWKSQIYEAGTTRHLGTFDDELVAARAYQVAVAKGYAAAIEELYPQGRRKNSSQFAGVAFCRYRGSQKKPWKAQIWFKGKVHSLGNHETELTASQVYEAAAARVRAGTFDPR
jgi:hypothetical protein